MGRIFIQGETDGACDDEVDHRPTLHKRIESVIFHECHFEPWVILHVDHSTQDEKVSLGKIGFDVWTDVQKYVVSSVHVDQRMQNSKPIKKLNMAFQNNEFLTRIVF